MQVFFSGKRLCTFFGVRQARQRLLVSFAIMLKLSYRRWSGTPVHESLGRPLNELQPNIFRLQTRLLGDPSRLSHFLPHNALDCVSIRQDLVG